MDELLEISPEVEGALDAGTAVVALESSLISHGMARPRNVEIALALEDIVRSQGAVPATIGVVGGRLKVGLDAGEIEEMGTTDANKVSRRDLGVVLAQGGIGGTTVAATMFAAAKAGIRVFATGGIGGVHRGAERTFDVSADLEELARTPVCVVCAGAKNILDLAKTLEYLETRGVPVIGYGTGTFPAFYTADSGLELMHRVETAADAARVLEVQWGLGLTGGMVIANPIPASHGIERATMERMVEDAAADAEAEGVRGKDVTPYLLDKLGELTAGKSLEANAALLKNNAAVAAQIAVAFAALTPATGRG
jgi:pseudouridine-5'-phosphate glycosidase